MDLDNACHTPKQPLAQRFIGIVCGDGPGDAPQSNSAGRFACVMPGSREVVNSCLRLFGDDSVDWLLGLLQVPSALLLQLILGLRVLTLQSSFLFFQQSAYFLHEFEQAFRVFLLRSLCAKFHPAFLSFPRQGPAVARGRGQKKADITLQSRHG
jgi:hypothetical protein